MHEHASKMELGDKETVAICIQASVTCYLHVIHRYTRMVRNIRVWGLLHKAALWLCGLMALRNLDQLEHTAPTRFRFL